MGDNAGLMSAALRRLPLVILSAVLLCTATARAQEKPDNKAAAKEHYNRGTSYYDLGKFTELPLRDPLTMKPMPLGSGASAK